VRELREGDRRLNEGKDLTEVVRHLEVSESSWDCWRAQCSEARAPVGNANLAPTVEATVDRSAQECKCLEGSRARVLLVVGADRGP
jgi:hypothetical protein